MSDYSTATATITDRWGGVESVDCGTQQTWAVEDGAALAPWKKMMRRVLLADRTHDPRGWRVVFTFAPCEEVTA